MARRVKTAIIGVGGMGGAHLNYMEKLPNIEVTALCDIDPQRIRVLKEKTANRYPVYADYRELVRKADVEGVLIATPHYFHPPISIFALQNGKHVLSEKPVGVTPRHFDQMVAAHKRHRGLVFGVMFQMRTMPANRAIKRIIERGELGAIRRINWIVTTWFRSQAYYDSGGWRATWDGEGGGVLLNQCPHNLDLMTWFFGMPEKVTAKVFLGKDHKIDVEDEVAAILEYGNGATGVFVTTTGEAPGTDRLEIAGDRGKLVSENGEIVLHKTKGGQSVRKYLKTTAERFSPPPMLKPRKVVLSKFKSLTGGRAMGTFLGQHAAVTHDWANCILRGGRPVAPIEEAGRGLELGNAMLMSGLGRTEVRLPVSRKGFDDLLAGLIEKTAGKSRKSKRR